MSNVINVELPGGDSVFVELGGGAELDVQIGADAQLHVDVIGEGPRGREGPQGVQGIQGVSPAVTIAEITGGHSVTITDADHPDGQAFNVMDGEDGDAGPAGQDGVSPAVSVTEITAGHTVTITDADHPSGQSFDVMDGVDGQDGQAGADGVSPAVTISSITGGHRVSVTDADHPAGQTFDVMDGGQGPAGQDGNDGVSPEITIASVTGGHSVTITDADHPAGQSFNVMDGGDGQQGPAGQDGVSPAVSVSTITGGHRVTITDADHPTGQTFDVMDGQNGQGTPGQSTPLADTTGGAVGSSTDFSREDHRHPLNVPTSGTPADLGTAALGSAATYARSDHVHKKPTASDIGALPDSTVIPTKTSDLTNDSGYISTSEVQYKIYDSVTDLGLTSGSATISGAWAALRAVAPAMLICPSSEFASAQRPEGNSYGTMVIAVSYSDDSVARGWVEFHGYGSGVGDYRQFLSSSIPSGTWVYASVNWKLMWTNNSPSSNYSSDTIPLDLGAFSEVMIVFNTSTSSAYTTTIVTPIDGTSSLMYCVTALASSTAMSLAGRYVTASSTGVTINAARVKPFSSASAGATDNSYFIPFKIYAR